MNSASRGNPAPIGCPLVRARIQRLVRGGQAPGGDIGEQARAGSVAQPVQRAARLPCCGDGLEHARQPGRDIAGSGGQQHAGPAAQAAPGAAALLIKLVLDRAVAAGVRDRDSGAASAGVSYRAGRGGQPPDLSAAGASPAAAQRRVVARVADRPFGPAGCRRPELAAVRAPGCGPGRAGSADRMIAGEVTRPFPAAPGADDPGKLVAVHADVRQAWPAMSSAVSNRACSSARDNGRCSGRPS
jgi:hypothetical protein